MTNYSIINGNSPFIPKEKYNISIEVGKSVITIWGNESGFTAKLHLDTERLKLKNELIELIKSL